MKNLSQLSLLTTGAVFTTFVLAASLLYEGFASPRVFANLLNDNASLGIAACGVTLVILSGGIDLSVGAVLSFTTVTLAVLLQRKGLHPFVAFAIVLALGTIFGAMMGLLIHAFEMPPFLVTLAGMFFARGMSFWVTGESIGISHSLYRDITGFSLPLIGNAALSAGALIWLVVFAAYVLLTHCTSFGRDVFALGGNEASASLMGVATGRTKICVYALNGGCAALAGIVATFFTGSGNPLAGSGLELDAIASAVIGGTLLAGGSGTIAGTFLGVLIFGTIQLIIVFDGRLNSWWQRIVMGVLLLVFILAQRALARTAGKSTLTASH